MLILQRVAAIALDAHSMIWTILGFSVAIVAVFCITVGEMLVGNPFFEHNREYIAGLLAAGGVAAWFVGRYFERKRLALPSENEEGGLTRRFILFDLRYWGPLLLVLGAITLFIRPLKQAKSEPVLAAATPAPKPIVVAAEPPPPPKPKGPVTFPHLKMQGIIYREDHPFVIINGQSYAVGDHLGDVLIKAIERTGVVLELSGEIRLLTLN